MACGCLHFIHRNPQRTYNRDCNRYPSDRRQQLCLHPCFVRWTTQRSVAVARRNCPQKRRAMSLAGESPITPFRFSSEDLAWLPDHNLVSPELFGSYGLSPSFPHFSVITLVVRVFSLPPMRNQSSDCGASFVPDSLDGHSRLSPSWKISLPLSSRIGFSAERLPAKLHRAVCRDS